MRRDRPGGAAHRAHPLRVGLRHAAPLARPRGYDVTFCRNVTDIDDKIIAKAADEGRPWWAVATQNERAFTWAYDVLGCLPPTLRAARHRARPRDGRADAAAHRAPATPTPPTGDVYFDVRSYPAYGALSGQRLDEMLARRRLGARRRKRDPRDFALWKGSRSRASRPGRRRGAGADPAGTSSARRWPASTSGPPSTSTAAASTWSSRTTRTRSPSRRRAGDDFAALLGAQRLGHDERREDEQVARATRCWCARWSSGCGRSSCATTSAAAHYRSMIEYSTRRWRRPPSAFRRIEGFVQRAAEASGRETSRHAPVLARPSSPRRWTTTSACRRRSPSCTTRSARATRRSPPATTPRSRPSLEPCARCSACSGSTRSPSRGRAAAGRRADRLESVLDAPRRRPARCPRRGARRARTSRPPTRSATGSPAPGVDDRGHAAGTALDALTEDGA